MRLWSWNKRPEVAAEVAAAKADLARAERRHAEVESRWPKVESIREALVTRRLENGFGEELTVAWTPRGR